jgi:hypothetical protein
MEITFSQSKHFDQVGLFKRSWFVIVFTIVSSKYGHAIVHIGLHNHFNAKGENWKALDRMNQSIKTYLEENPSPSLKAISCKLVQWEFLQLFMRKDLVMDGEML